MKNKNVNKHEINSSICHNMNTMIYNIYINLINKQL